MKTKQINYGFTLVEVMVAVVVLGIGIASVLTLIGQATRAVNTARGVTIQTGLARLKMVEIENMYWQKKPMKLIQAATSATISPTILMTWKCLKTSMKKSPPCTKLI